MNTNQIPVASQITVNQACELAQTETQCRTELELLIEAQLQLVGGGDVPCW